MPPLSTSKAGAVKKATPTPPKATASKVSSVGPNGAKKKSSSSSVTTAAPTCSKSTKATAVAASRLVSLGTSVSRKSAAAAAPPPATTGAHRKPLPKVGGDGRSPKVKGVDDGVRLAVDDNVQIDAPTGEETVYAAMTLMLKELLRNEPPFDDEELLTTSAVAPGNVAQWERDHLLSSFELEAKFSPPKGSRRGGGSAGDCGSGVLDGASNRGSENPGASRLSAASTSSSASSTSSSPHGHFYHILHPRHRSILRMAERFDSATLGQSNRKAAAEAHAFVEAVLSFGDGGESDGGNISTQTALKTSYKAESDVDPSSAGAHWRSSDRCAARFYQVVTSLCVYCNVNTHLQTTVAEHAALYLRICRRGQLVTDIPNRGSVTAAPDEAVAKRLFGSSVRKEASDGSGAGAKETRPLPPAAVQRMAVQQAHTSGGAEVEGSGGGEVSYDTFCLPPLPTSIFPRSVVGAVTDAFDLEGLLNYGLPPAVCSTKYEGLMTLLHERKGRVAAEILACRGILPALFRSMQGVAPPETAITPTHLLNLLRMAQHSIPRVQAKFFDRFAQDGGLWCLLRVGGGCRAQPSQTQTISGKSRGASPTNVASARSAMLITTARAATPEVDDLQVALDALLIIMDPDLEGVDPLLDGGGCAPSSDGEMMSVNKKSSISNGSTVGSGSKPRSCAGAEDGVTSQQTAVTRSSAWSTDTLALSELLTFLVNAVRNAAATYSLTPLSSVVGDGKRSQTSVQRTPKRPSASSTCAAVTMKAPHTLLSLPVAVASLWSKMSLLLQYVVVHSAEAAAVVVGVIDMVLEQVLCSSVQLFLPAILTLLKRPETAEHHEESVAEWFAVLAAQVTFLKKGGSSTSTAGLVATVPAATAAVDALTSTVGAGSRRSLLATASSKRKPPAIAIPPRPISPRPGSGIGKGAPPSPTSQPPQPQGSHDEGGGGTCRRLEETVLSKDAMEGLAPYLAFARAVAMHTHWRGEGVTLFLSRCVNVADTIVRQCRRRPNMIFGIACDCLLVVGPLLITTPSAPQSHGGVDHVATNHPITVAATIPRPRRSGAKRSRSRSPTPSEGQDGGFSLQSITGRGGTHTKEQSYSPRRGTIPDLSSLCIASPIWPLEQWGAEPCSPQQIKLLPEDDTPHSPVVWDALGMQGPTTNPATTPIPSTLPAPTPQRRQLSPKLKKGGSPRATGSDDIGSSDGVTSSPAPLTSQAPWRERMSLALFGSNWGSVAPPERKTAANHT